MRVSGIQLNIQIKRQTMNISEAKCIPLKQGFQPLQQSHSEQVIGLLVKTFLKNNRIWSKFNLKQQQLHNFFKNIVNDHLQCQKRAQQYIGKDTAINYIYVQNGKIISVLLQYEVEQYRLKQLIKNKPYDIELFNKLQKYGKQLIKDIDLTKLEKGKHLYGNMGAVDETAVENKFTFSIAFQYVLYCKQKGFKTMFARTSNLKANSIYQKMGAKTVKIVQFKQDGITEPLSILHLDYDNPLLNQLVQKYQEKQTNKFKPKL